ncbi:MAG: DUF6505 family protein [Rubrimonas sp.]
MKLPRTIRLDPSDTLVFDAAAEPGEWAVSAAFLFAEADLEALSRKARTACRAGFLGIDSWGFSTLVVVSEATAGERAAAEARLADQFVARLGAPDRETALPAAREEIAFAESLCADHPAGMLLAVHRAVEGGGLRETFRSLRPRQPGEDPHGRAFIVIETDEAEQDEHVDLLDLEGRP